MIELNNFKSFVIKELEAIKKLLDIEGKRKKLNIELIVKLELHKHNLKNILKFYDN